MPFAPNPAVDPCFATAKEWPEVMAALRPLVLEAGLTEELKWHSPCYTHQGGNVAMIGELKAFCALSFFKGVLLKDAAQLLHAPGENSRAARLFRFTSAEEVSRLRPTILAYLREAMTLEETGAKVDFEKDAELPWPEELSALFASDPAFRQAFEALTPGRQRGYLLFFSAPKQARTRTSRIEKHRSRILAGKGMHDR
jgi:uncharacterized protein YdeI (YjbR/CyaY-like superfamily)